MKIVYIEKESLHIFWTTYENIKSHKKAGLHDLWKMDFRKNHTGVWFQGQWISLEYRQDLPCQNLTNRWFFFLCFEQVASGNLLICIPDELMASVLNYVPRVPYMAFRPACLCFLHAFLFYVPCVCSFFYMSYVPSFFDVPYVRSFFHVPCMPSSFNVPYLPSSF